MTFIHPCLFHCWDLLTHVHFNGVIFIGTTLLIYINTTCYLCSSPGALNFFLLVEIFEVDRQNGQGHLYFGVDIILIKHLCKSKVGASRLDGPIISCTDHCLSVNNSPICIWPKNENVRSGVLHLSQAQCKRTFTIGPNTCQLAIATVGRPGKRPRNR